MKLVTSFARIEIYTLNVFILGMDKNTFADVKTSIERWLEIRGIDSSSYNTSQWLTFRAGLNAVQQAELQKFLGKIG